MKAVGMGDCNGNRVWQISGNRRGGPGELYARPAAETGWPVTPCLPSHDGAFPPSGVYPAPAGRDEASGDRLESVVGFLLAAHSPNHSLRLP